MTLPQLRLVPLLESSWFHVIMRMWPSSSNFNLSGIQTEDRWITMGLDRTGTLLVVCHDYRDETKSNARIHLISAHKATKNEIEQYKRE